MAAKEFAGKHILIDQQSDAAAFIIHKAQDRNRARGDVQKLGHKFRLCKGEPCGADLPGKSGGAEFLSPRQQEKIEISFLGISQKQILTDVYL